MRARSFAESRGPMVYLGITGAYRRDYTRYGRKNPRMSSARSAGSSIDAK